MKTDFDTDIADELDQHVRTQWAHCQIWINQFQKNKDGASVRCLAFALGRVSGAYTALASYMKDQPIGLVAQKIHKDCEHWFEQMNQVPLVARKD